MNTPIIKNKNLISKQFPKNTSRSQQEGTFFGTLFMLVLIVGMVLFTFYIMQLDNTITTKFEGKRWNIPAKVYSRPLDLYEGANVDTKTLDSWLEMLNYRKTKQYKQTGSYHKANRTYYIHTRGFEYSNEDIDSDQVIKLTISNNKIRHIQSTQPNDTGIVRLEPITIGGIYPDNNEDRIIVSIDEVPQPLIDALISTEDRRFYEHYGVSFRGIARAVVNNFSGKSMQGGSTLTQQLIKNFYLNSERSLKRKANEALMALLIERHYEKDVILETYMNEINLGQNGNRSINGFGLASEFYFNRPLDELRLDQQALLVGIAKGPSYYNPRRNPERATKRRNTVLNNMLVMGNIDQKEYDQAIKKPLDVLKKPVAGKSRFPDFLDVVKRELNAVYYADDLKNEGLRIVSTLDPLAQMSADKSIDNKIGQLRKISSKTKSLEGALVSANPLTGELVAVVGGTSFTGFNRAVDAKRQVGSLLKPIIYLNALETGKYNLASSVDDRPITLKIGTGGTWSPKNYGGRNHGSVALTTALAKSYNQAAVRVGMEFGMDEFIDKLHVMGVEAEINAQPSALLGATELSPMDMLNVYQVFATGGFRTPIHSIRSVVDNKGRVLQRAGLNTQKSVDSKANYLVNYALQQVVASGTAKKAQALGKNLNLAGKTGTTNNYKDAWFAGYSGNYVSVVWIGRDDNKSIGLSGGSGALPVWMDYMKHLNLAPVNLQQPEGIEWLWLENNDGRLSHEECMEGKYLPVMSKYVPKQASQCAIALYQAKEAAKKDTWLKEKLAIVAQRYREGLITKEQAEKEGLVFGDSNSNNQHDQSSSDSNQPKPFEPQNTPKPFKPAQDNWLEKVLELF